MIEVDIEVPKDDGSFTSLRDVAPANSKGKKSQGASSGIQVNSGKRRREEDANLRFYDSASHTVASFLRGPSGSFPAQAISTDTVNALSTSILEGPESPDALTHTSSPFTQDSLASSNFGFNSREQSISTLGTTPSPPPQADANISTSFTAVRPGNTSSGSSNVTQAVARPGSSNGSANSNPFAYLETPNNFPPVPPPISLQSHYNPSVTTSWSSGHGSGFATSPFGQVQIPAQAEPIHPHAYVTFGAGMRQKEIDIFTAQHKLEARYLTGDGDGIPYHVPL